MDQGRFLNHVKSQLKWHQAQSNLKTDRHGTIKDKVSTPDFLLTTAVTLVDSCFILLQRVSSGGQSDKVGCHGFGKCHLYQPTLIYKEQRLPLSLQSEESQLHRDTFFVWLKTRVQASLQSTPQTTEAMMVTEPPLFVWIFKKYLL